MYGELTCSTTTTKTTDRPPPERMHLCIRGLRRDTHLVIIIITTTLCYISVQATPMLNKKNRLPRVSLVPMPAQTSRPRQVSFDCHRIDRRWASTEPKTAVLSCIGTIDFDSIQAVALHVFVYFILIPFKSGIWKKKKSALIVCDVIDSVYLLQSNPDGGGGL